MAAPDSPPGSPPLGGSGSPWRQRSCSGGDGDCSGSGGAGGGDIPGSVLQAVGCVRKTARPLVADTLGPLGFTVVDAAGVGPLSSSPQVEHPLICCLSVCWWSR